MGPRFLFCAADRMRLFVEIHWGEVLFDIVAAVFFYYLLVEYVNQQQRL